MQPHPWDTYSKVYASDIETLTLPMAQILFDSLNIEKATNVLEVGTGNGQNLQYFIQQKPLSCHWYATDASQVMLSICQQRIEEFLNNPIQKVIHDYKTEQIPQFIEKTIKQINVSFKQVDATNLLAFEAEMFDRYLAVLVLNNKIEQQEAMLKEAYRVLKTNGLIGLTVFGRKENSPFQSYYKQIAISLGLDQTKFPPDIFETQEKSQLLSRIEKLGFNIQKAFYVCFPINNSKVKGEAQLAEGSMKRKVLVEAGATQELIQKIIQQTVEKFEEYENINKAPITMETLFIIAKKL